MLSCQEPKTITVDPWCSRQNLRPNSKSCPVRSSADGEQRGDGERARRCLARMYIGAGAMTKDALGCLLRLLLSSLSASTVVSIRPTSTYVSTTTYNYSTYIHVGVPPVVASREPDAIIAGPSHHPYPGSCAPSWTQTPDPRKPILTHAHT